LAATEAAAVPAAAEASPAPAVRADGYARGARVLSVGIASTGVFTFAYFAVARHVLNAKQYGAVSLLWSVLFIVISIIYRPVEQLLSRTIARRRALGHEGGHPLRAPIAIQLSFAGAFLVAALALRGPIERSFDGSATLYWVLVGATLAYGGSYFARGYLAGHQWFGLYGGLVLFESLSRFAFPLAVAVGLFSGQGAVAVGIVAAPFASLLVVPWALARHAATGSGAARAAGGAAMRASAAFGLSVAAVMLAEQTLLNAAVLTAKAGAGSAVAGVVFNALLIARAPLQLFQSIQTSLLPHLSGLDATEGSHGFARAIRITVLAIAAFAGAVALGLLAVGPFAMNVVFGHGHHYPRVGLALIGVGMGFHLVSGTLNQAALARGQARTAAAAWLLAAAVFLGWMVAPLVHAQLLRAELGYAGAAALLSALLYAVYRRPARAAV
jgi:O-antigen/teichoic acid export membrane protein